jgi:hypothetical protein
MTREQIRQIQDRYVDGDTPAAIAAALGLDETAVLDALGLTPSAPAAASMKLAPRKRVRKAAPEADASAPAQAPAFDAANFFGDRNGGASQRNHGYGYATVRGQLGGARKL